MCTGHLQSSGIVPSYQPVSNVSPPSNMHTGHLQSSGVPSYQPVSNMPAPSNVHTGHLQLSGAVPSYQPVSNVPAPSNVHTEHFQLSGVPLYQHASSVPAPSNVHTEHFQLSAVPLYQHASSVPALSNVNTGHLQSSGRVPSYTHASNGNSLYNGRLSEEQQDQLASFIGKGPKDFHLLYSAQRDTCSPDAFHRHCDYEGPTVTVLYNPKGTVYGGYTSMSWFQAEGVYVLDPSAFLFQLKKNGNSSFKKFPCTDPINAISCDTNKAAVFGNGPDLHLMNGPITRTNLGFFPLDGEINCGSYNMQGVDKAGFCDDTLEVTEIEVYHITGNYSYNGRLSGDQREKLVSFIGKGPKDFEPLYSARLDTYSPDAFYRHCDYKGPTVTVLYNPYDTVYGGYESMSWIQAGGVYVSDPSAFLFQLKKNGKSSFKKFPCIDPMNAIFCDTNKAAVFGNGQDLHLMNEPITRTNFGSYNMNGVDKAGFCDDTLDVIEIEVYSLTGAGEDQTNSESGISRDE